jgi:hypothetical protein
MGGKVEEVLDDVVDTVVEPPSPLELALVVELEALLALVVELDDERELEW